MREDERPGALTLGRYQELVAEAGCDGWLIADFRWNNPLFAQLLGLQSGILTRRCFLWLPRVGHGEPLAIASRVDAHTLAAVSCAVALYAGFDEMAELLVRILPPDAIVAMEYVEQGALPTVSRVDAGLVDLIRSYGVRVVSSGELIARLEVWDERQRALHERAAAGVDEARRSAIERCSVLLERGERVTEGLLADHILTVFAERGLVAADGPDVAVGANAADPHYAVMQGMGADVARDAVLLIDLWARVADDGDAPYADSTWMAYVGETIPGAIQRAFDVTRAARDAAIDIIEQAGHDCMGITGAAVDREARRVVEVAGLGEALVHRTGHSLGRDHVHGMGTNLDSIEFPDERPLVPWSGFTIEPGVYVPGQFGIRLEVSCVLTPSSMHITTERQTELTRIG